MAHVIARETPAAAGSGLFAGYSAPDGSYDETFAEGGEPRPHWQKVVQTLEDMGPRELAHCWQQARRMIHENGVTYNVYGDAQGMERPWELDPLPWVIGSAEWACLEAALAQRARLLNAVLADVYGPQRLLTEGLLPPELLFAHPGFLRPCHGLAVPNDCYLHVYAADLARTPDGQWWVLADRAQSPAGSGYALENRQVLSSILPEVLRDCQVQRLASYFAALRQTLHDVALRHRDNPRIVLLTPGPYNETYFEHAYLARYLGYTLVEGGDLTVRDERVYLKTLAGLEPVDVILRRMDDAFCDPLELNQASLLGTAGPGAGGAGRQRQRRQYAGQRLAGKRRVDAVSACLVPPSVGRRACPAVGADVVVRGHGQPGLRARPPGGARGDADALRRGPGHGAGGSPES